MESENPFSQSADGSEQTPPVMPEVSQDDRTMGMISHLSGPVLLLLGVGLIVGFLGPLVIWMIKKDDSPFVADQAKEALNFQIAVILSCLVATVTCVGIILLPVLLIGDLVYSIIAAMAANKGEYYRYPYTFRLVK